MKIAHVVPVMNTVPPEKYGGIEAVVEQLAEGQSAAGHQIVIFCAKGSKSNKRMVNLIASSPYPTAKKLAENRRWEIHEFLQVVEMQDNFDLIHFHYEPLIARHMIDGLEFNFLNYIHVPTVITFHNTTDIRDNIQYYRAHKELWRHNYVFISKSHRAPLAFFPHSQVIYNGTPVKDYVFNDRPDDSLLFMGRINKVKGVVEAIQVAKRAQKKLVIAARVDSVDREFFERRVKPFIDGKQIVNIGEVNFKQKLDLYKKALCTLFPISWEEPFGLVMTESMACGTPVIAFKRGSVPEIIKHGETGYVVKNVSQMVAAVKKIKQISRRACRQRVERLFSSQIMVKNYLKLYNKVLKAGSK